MQIIVYFHFNGEAEAAATTGVRGHVSDLILPCVGDVVRHRMEAGTPFVGKVTERLYDYSLANGEGIDGTVSVTLLLDRILIQ